MCWRIKFFAKFVVGIFCSVNNLAKNLHKHPCKHSRQDMFKRIVKFYVDGFRRMTVGRSLWVLILIKLAVMFLVLKLFFFPDVLGELSSDEERAEAVRQNLTESTR